MDNKRKKKLTIIIMIILFIFLLSLIIFLSFRKKEENNLEKSSLVITEKKTFKDYQYQDMFNDYLWVSLNNKMGAIQKNGDVVVDFKYTNNALITKDNKALVINDGGNYYLYDKDLKLINSSNKEISIISDYYDGEDYYYLNGYIYNFNHG